MPKTKFQVPDMEFNVGLKKFEPKLPLTNKKIKVTVNWKWLIILAILFILWMAWPLLVWIFI